MASSRQSVLYIDPFISFSDKNEEVVFVCVSDPAQALERLEKENFHTVICEYRFPHITGEELIKTIKSQFPYMPVILHSHCKEPEAIRQCFLAGASDYVIKSQDPLALMESVKRFGKGDAFAQPVSLPLKDQLKFSSDFFLQLLNRIPDPIFVKDRQHRWILLNDALCKMVGHSRESMMGKSDFDFFPEEEAKIFWQKDEEAFAMEGENENTETLTDSQGKTYTIHTKKGVFRDPRTGEKVLVGILRDVTRTLELEEKLKKKIRELNDFVYIVSHDLQNPLTIMKSYLAFIKDDPEKFNIHFDKINNNLESMSCFIAQLLKMSRAGTVIEQKEDVELLVFTKSLFVTQKTKTGIQAQLTIPPDIPRIYGDSVRIGQVLTNLIDNAFKYRDPRKETLLIEVGYEKKAKSLMIYIKDNGKGLDPQFIDKIFHPGFTLNKSQGSGFGLCIVRKIVEAHGGTIHAHSLGEDQGMTFFLEFPLPPSTT